ncbi:MAG: DEAD/DEAH box helicase family protein [Deltaproteobacteria bacterium]|nr:DEAD/DEAH box helicase family protein [Deltaproteobacteria bacterium]
MPDDFLELNGPSWKFLAYPDSYVETCRGSNRPLALEPTRRQFRTANEILCRISGAAGYKRVGGVLLADDVGLGKTTIAALVAWVVAGHGKSVRIYAPNSVMQRRWAEELQAHINPLRARAQLLQDINDSQLKVGDVGRLRSGRIQIGTHHQLVQLRGSGRAACDLMIVDEAHRAKGENSAFSQALADLGRMAKSKLILTATPFSIDVDELVQLLGFVGAQGVDKPVERYALALERLHRDSAGRSVEEEASRLVQAAQDAIEATAPYVIRHGIASLSEAERTHFGDIDARGWPISVPPAGEEDVELLIRADRYLRLTPQVGRTRTNDPRYHVGWAHLATDLADEDRLQAAADFVAERHLNAAKNLLKKRMGSPHPKMLAVVRAIDEVVEREEKVLVFCHHRATAAELLGALEANLKPRTLSTESAKMWRQAWDAVIPKPELGQSEELPTDVDELRATFLDWLASKGIRSQVSAWIGPHSGSVEELAEKLRDKKPRGRTEDRVLSIAEAAEKLFNGLIDGRSRSTLAVLRTIEHQGTWLAMSGGLDKGTRTLGSWDATGSQEQPKTLYQGSPDVILAVFNSPFGPDVLVATDRLSEGVDLHRYCCHLVHYELDPSPVRTLQRNGRVRRVGGWASLTNQPIRYAFPSFEGTRDGKAVQIMKVRLDVFDLLLGGVPPVDMDVDTSASQTFVTKVLGLARKKLAGLNMKLAVAG